MKEFICLLFLFSKTIILQAQNNNDINRIVLNSVVIDRENKIPSEAKDQLLSKLTQVSSKNGLGGSNINPRFVLAAKINIQTKDIVSGPPQMVALNAEIVFFIGDAETNKVFATASIIKKGIGANENKALISLINDININSKDFIELTQQGKNKIIDNYSIQCDFITRRAIAKSQQKKFDEAIYDLMQVPEVCKACYLDCLSAVQPIYKKKIDYEGLVKFNDAKSKWNANQNLRGAEDAAIILSTIDPESISYKSALTLSETIKEKIKEIEKRNWEFKMKKYNDAINIESQRIESAKQTAIAYYQNQPKILIYNRILW